MAVVSKLFASTSAVDFELSGLMAQASGRADILGHLPMSIPSAMTRFGRWGLDRHAHRDELDWKPYQQKEEE